MNTEKAKKTESEESKESMGKERGTERTDITFSDEKKACLKFIFKCWRDDTLLNTPDTPNRVGGLQYFVARPAVGCPIGVFSTQQTLLRFWAFVKV